MDLLDRIIAYEDGSLDYEGCLTLFAELIKTGMAWELQGCYGRTAKVLIEQGCVTVDGEVLKGSTDESDG